MAYGIEVRNDAGIVLIDGQYSNLHQLYRFSRSVSFSPANSNALYCPAKHVSFPSPVTSIIPPLIGIRATGGRVGFGGLSGSPGNWTGFYVLTDIEGGASSPRSVAFVCEVYAQASHNQLPKVGNYGAQVFSAGGGLIFDSRSKPLSVTSPFSFSTPPNGSSVAEMGIGQTKATIANQELVDANTLGFCVGTSNVSPTNSIHIRAKLMAEPTAGGNKIAIYRVFFLQAGFAVGYPNGSLFRLGTQHGGSVAGIKIQQKI